MFEVMARLKVRDGQLAGFKDQGAEMMRQTREKDTKTLRYDWFLSDDGTECEVREGYVDADALIEHAHHVAEARDSLFRDFAYDHEMTLYGEPSPALAELIQRLSGIVPFRRCSLLRGLEDDIDAGAPCATSAFNQHRSPRATQRAPAGPAAGWQHSPSECCSCSSRWCCSAVRERACGSRRRSVTAGTSRPTRTRSRATEQHWRR